MTDGQTDRQTYISTSRAAPSQLKSMNKKNIDKNTQQILLVPEHPVGREVFTSNPRKESKKNQGKVSAIIRFQEVRKYFYLIRTQQLRRVWSNPLCLYPDFFKD